MTILYRSAARPLVMMFAGATFALALSAATTSEAGTVINFDSVSVDPSIGYVTGPTVANYLGKYGVTFSSSYANIQPYIQLYPSWLDAVSAPNFFSPGGSAVYFTFDLSFSKPLESLDFTIPGQGYATMAAWSATAYSASNVELSTASNPDISFPYSSQQTVSLAGPDISYVVFSSNAYDFAGDNLSFDNLTLNVPEPSGWVMMLAGMFGLGALLRRARRYTPGRSAHCVV
jgi:hypothetical protein